MTSLLASFFSYFLMLLFPGHPLHNELIIMRFLAFLFLPLFKNEWGNGKLLQYDSTDSSKSVPKVYNWDGKLSPVVHQFDRHKVLSEYWYKTKTNQYRQAWMMKLASSSKNKHT